MSTKGGRPENLIGFKPGQSGNPGGRGGVLPPEIRKKRKASQAKIISLMTDLLNLTDLEANARAEDPKQTQLEAMAQAMIASARNGETSAAKYVVELICGKIPETDHDGFSEEDLRMLNRVKELLTEQRSEPGDPSGGDRASH